MELSIFLAKYLGLYFLIVGALWILRRSQFEAIVQDIFSKPGLSGLSGILALLFGLAIAIAHPVWELNWRGLITVLAYLSIVKGILRVAFLKQTDQFALKFLKKGYWISIAILLVLGVVLTYYGFAVEKKPWFLGIF